MLADVNVGVGRESDLSNRHLLNFYKMQKPYLVIIGVSMFFTALFTINAIHSFNEKLSCHSEQEALGLGVMDLLADKVPANWD